MAREVAVKYQEAFIKKYDGTSDPVAKEMNLCIWNGIQELSDEEAEGVATRFLNEDISPFHVNGVSEDVKPALLEYLPKYLEIGKKMYATALINWQSLRGRTTADEVRTKAVEYIDAPKFDFGQFGQMTVFSK